MYFLKSTYLLSINGVFKQIIVIPKCVHIVEWNFYRTLEDTPQLIDLKLNSFLCGTGPSVHGFNKVGPDIARIHVVPTSFQGELERLIHDGIIVWVVLIHVTE